jgi:hypothetical protein
MTPLILKRASASRSSGQWSDDDYDVLENGAVVVRIFLSAAAAPRNRPWMWANGHSGDIRRGAHGYEPTARRRWRRSPSHGGGGTAVVNGPLMASECNPPTGRVLLRPQEP